MGVEYLLPSYVPYCILNLTVRKSYCMGCFLGGSLKQMNTFFPLNKRSVFTGSYSIPLYPKARSRTYCHSPSHAFSTIVYPVSKEQGISGYVCSVSSLIGLR